MPRINLGKTTVVRAAAELVNTEGWEQLSLGKLATKLRVQPPSLYNHINGLPGLARELRLLSTREQGECMARAAIGQSGPQAVRRVAQAYREYIKGNLGVYLMGVRSSALQSPVDAELEAAQAQVLQTGMAVLATFELSEAETLHALRGLRSLIHGFATLEAAGGFGLPVDCDESFWRLTEMFINELSSRE